VLFDILGVNVDVGIGVIYGPDARLRGKVMYGVMGMVFGMLACVGNG